MFDMRLAIFVCGLAFILTECSLIQPLGAKLGIFNQFPTIEEPEADDRSFCRCAASQPELDDFSDEYLLKANKRKVIKYQWSRSKPPLTAKGKKMKDTILLMTDSDVGPWLKKAMITSFFSQAMFAQADKMPTLKVYAKLVDASIAWEKNMDGDALGLALDDMVMAMQGALENMANSSLVESGCGRFASATYTTLPASAVSTVSSADESYNIDEMWKLKGGMFSCDFEKSAKELKTSSNYTDRVMAVMATLSLSDAFQDIIENYDKKQLFEYLQWQNDTTIPYCCCATRLAKFQELQLKQTVEVTRSISIVKAKYKKNWKP